MKRGSSRKQQRGSLEPRRLPMKLVLTSQRPSRTARAGESKSGYIVTGPGEHSVKRTVSCRTPPLESVYRLAIALPAAPLTWCFVPQSLLQSFLGGVLLSSPCTGVGRVVVPEQLNSPAGCGQLQGVIHKCLFGEYPPGGWAFPPPSPQTKKEMPTTPILKPARVRVRLTQRRGVRVRTTLTSGRGLNLTCEVQYLVGHSTLLDRGGGSLHPIVLFRNTREHSFPLAHCG